MSFHWCDCSTKHRSRDEISRALICEGWIWNWVLRWFEWKNEKGQIKSENRKQTKKQTNRMSGWNNLNYMHYYIYYNLYNKLDAADRWFLLQVKLSYIMFSAHRRFFFFCLFSKPKYGSIRWWSLVIIFFWFMKEKIGLGFQHLRDWGQCLWWARWDGNSKTVGGKTKTMNWRIS